MNGKLFNPTAKATYNDINFGIPSFMTCIESVIFSLIFHWTFSRDEYSESRRRDRFGGQAKRISTAKAILDALNLSDIIAGTFTALQWIVLRLQNRYSGRKSLGPQRQKTLRMEETHLEPLGQPIRSQHSNSSDDGEDYDAPSYPPPNRMGVPAMPTAARDPSPLGRAQTHRADHLRPETDVRDNGPYSRNRYDRENSPSYGEPSQRPNEFL
jgi:hypothetical protein